MGVIICFPSEKNVLTVLRNVMSEQISVLLLKLDVHHVKESAQARTTSNFVSLRKHRK